MSYNLFAQQKQQYNPNAQRPQQVGSSERPSYEEWYNTVPSDRNDTSNYRYVPRMQATTPQTNSRANDAAMAARAAGKAVWGDNGTGTLGEYDKWKRTYNGGADNAQGVLDYLAAQVTTPQEEERMRKASVANQRILAVGDALRHIGNIFNTSRYAPAQQFNSPVEDERKRYLQNKSILDTVNQRYLTYQQAKDKQDAKMKEIAARESYNDFLKRNMEANAQYRNRQLDERERDNEKRAEQRDREIGIKETSAKAKADNDRYRAVTGRMNAATSSRNATTRAKAEERRMNNPSGGSGNRGNTKGTMPGVSGTKMPGVK